MGRKFARNFLKPLASLNLGQHFVKYKRQPEPVKPVSDDEDELLIDTRSPERIALSNLNKVRNGKTEITNQDGERKHVTEKELQVLSDKIERLLLKLDEPDDSTGASALSAGDEELLPRCVICVTSRATMQTFPCGHRVVCRKCFVKTIQMAVNQKILPLRCIICRAKILKLKQVNQLHLQYSSSNSLQGSFMSVASSSSSNYSLGETAPHIPQSTSLQAMPSSTSPSVLYSSSPFGQQRLVRHSSETFDRLGRQNSLRSRKVYNHGSRSCYQIPSPGWSLPSSLPSPCEEDEKDLEDEKSDIDDSIITVKEVSPLEKSGDNNRVEVHAVVHEPHSSNEAKKEFQKEFWSTIVANDPNSVKNQTGTKLRHSHSMVVHKEEELRERAVRSGSFRATDKVTTAMVRSESAKCNGSSLKKSTSVHSMKKSNSTIFRSPSTHSIKPEPSKQSSNKVIAKR